MNETEQLLENNINTLNGEIKETEKNVSEYTELKFFAKKMLKFQLILGLLILGLNVIGNLTFYHNIKLLSNIYTFSVNILGMVGLCSVYWGIVKYVANKKIKGFTSKLNKGISLKNQYTHDLELEKENQKFREYCRIKSNKLNALDLYQDKITDIDINNELNLAYKNGINNKPKHLALTRTKK